MQLLGLGSAFLSQCPSPALVSFIGKASNPWTDAHPGCVQGTCDELALDVLVNMLLGFSRDFCGLKKVYIGGVNRSWPLPEEDKEEEEPEVCVCVGGWVGLWVGWENGESVEWRNLPSLNGGDDM